MQVSEQQIVAAFAEELASVLDAFLQCSTHAGISPGAWVPGWTARCTAHGAEPGTLFLTIADADAKRLTATVLGTDSVNEGEIVDTLTEVVAQAAGALSQRPEAAGGKVSVKDVGRVAPAGALSPSVLEFPISADFALRMGCGFLKDQQVAAPPPPPKPAPAPVAQAAVSAASHSNLDVLMDIDLPLTVHFGETEMPILNISKLGPGSIIDLGRSPDDPVEVLVNGKVIARGEVVVVAGNYGVRITEVSSTADRVRSLGPRG
jgi:flagellar motor switch protein FliN/FliY